MIQKEASFNRTYLELKLGVVLPESIGNRSFNRTYLELKLRFGQLLKALCTLLIAPIWN